MGDASTGAVGALAGTVLSGRYRLETKLGSGGMSTVYLSRDETLERWVAAKVLHREISDQPDQIERFRREARSVAQLSHPNVVAVIDAGEDGGRPYIVFEYIDGETLKQRIERLGRLPLDEAAAYAIEIGRGLAAAHARRLIHRDVKPQNVLIDPEGRAKVTDFGIARELETDGLTRTGRVLGTTDYVSPEQAMGQAVDARSDIYSLGIVLFEMLVGKVPFEAETQVGVAMKHVNERIPNVQKLRPEVSAALTAVVERATEKDPKRRYPEIGGMLADLEEALEVEVARAGGSSGEATTVLKSVPARHRRIITSRNASVAGILLVLAATAAALLIAGVIGGDEERKRGPGPPPSGAEIEITDAQDFDPEGTGGEHPEEVGFAVDSNPQTGWSTETYVNGPEVSLSGKDGVGFIVDAGEPVAADELQILSPTPGWTATIYGAPDGPPEDLAGWGEPISDAVAIESDDGQAIQLDSTTENRYYLIWITSLAETEGGFGAEINEVELAG
jgi:tRNA A-37 threonylcarbamoyl transferase component Bud32